MLLHDLVTKSCKEWPRRTVLSEGDRTCTYEAFGHKVDGYAASLIQSGLKTGDRVALISRNSIEWAAFYFAISKAGGISVPLNHALASSSIAASLRHAAATSAYVESALETRLKKDLSSVQSLKVFYNEHPPHSSRCSARSPSRSAPRRERDPGSIVYTSGSEGSPRGVTLSHRSLVANSRAVALYLGLSQRDRAVAVLPFYYIFGLSQLLSHITVGGEIVIENRFLYPNTVLDTIEKTRATGFAGVSSHYAILLDRSEMRQRRLESVRYFLQAGDPMPERLTRELGALYPNKKIFLSYGQTEAGPRLTYLDPSKILLKPLSVGGALPGVEIAVVGRNSKKRAQGMEAEVIARGPNIMLGYWGDKGATKRVLKKGWLYTGDMGYRDRDGDLFIVGRKEDLIKVGGNRVSPSEVERVVMMHKEVAEAAAFGIPDRILGKRIALAVVPKRHARFTVGELKLYCKLHLPTYLVPSRITKVLALPKSTSGKIDKTVFEKIEEIVK